MNQQNDLRSKLMFAAVNCGHSISHDSITLQRDDRAEGNALHQLVERLVTAATPPAIEAPQALSEEKIHNAITASVGHLDRLEYIEAVAVARSVERVISSAALPGAALPAPAHADFETWARAEGLIQESHGIMSVSSVCEVARKAFDAGGAAVAAKPAVVPEGWALLPITITEEMHVAAVRAITRATGNDDCPPSVWRAMLAAAPSRARPQPIADAEPSAREQKLAGRINWTTKQWYEHVGARENGQDEIVFGAVMALRAMMVQFQEVTLFASGRPAAQPSPAPASPALETTAALLEQLSVCAGGMVNGNRLASRAKAAVAIDGAALGLRLAVDPNLPPRVAEIRGEGSKLVMRIDSIGAEPTGEA